MKYIGTLIRLLFFALFLFLLAKGKVMLWLVLFAVSLLVALIFGSVYCGYACPMNTVMIPTEWLSKKMKIQTSKEPKWLKKSYWGWVALFVSIIGMLVAKRLFHMELPILLLWLFVSFFVTLRYKPAVFHNFLCPFGVLQRAFGRFARISERVDKSTCVGCRLCEEVCPSHAILVSSNDQKAAIQTSLCHQCANCQQVCPTGAIHYGKPLD